MKLILLETILALLLTLQQSAFSTDVTWQLVDHLGSIIGQLHDAVRQKSFDCWFYCSASSAYGNDLLNAVLVSKPLQDIPLIHESVAATSVSSTIPDPRLIVVLLDTLDEDSTQAYLEKFFDRFDRNIKYIVIFQWTTLTALHQLIACLQKLHLYNILYIPVYDGDFETFEQASYDVFADRIDIHSLNATLHNLFPDHARSMHGMTINFPMVHHLPFVDFVTVPPSGFDVLLARTFFETLNCTFNPIRFYCSPGEAMLQCIMRKFANTSSVFHLKRAETTYLSNDLVVTVYPSSMSIIVPSSSS